MMSESKRMVTGFLLAGKTCRFSAPLQSRTGGASEKSMSRSLLAAMARMSRFCSFVSFFIGSPFVGFRGAGRGDANEFLIVVFMENRNWQKESEKSLRTPIWANSLVLEFTLRARDRRQ